MDLPKTQDKRSRGWTTLVYPESAVDNWMDLLGSQCFPVMISPLHDLDVNVTGEPKNRIIMLLCILRAKRVGNKF